MALCAFLLAISLGVTTVSFRRKANAGMDKAMTAVYDSCSSLKKIILEKTKHYGRLFFIIIDLYLGAIKALAARSIEPIQMYTNLHIQNLYNIMRYLPKKKLFYFCEIQKAAIVT
jgi:hypothetical protein